MADHRTSEKLHHCWARFRCSWDDARERWRDTVADRFEREFVIPWQDELDRAIAELSALEEVLASTERETAPPSRCG